ncbi:hypothetical protein [Noviherbaspirillum sp.]|jgi:hypothetical protein|uniref:hypothetical protein n=1 Tax=Noviherbaspirillum sp. TaxID=1926288 RepID=UPI0025E9436E|nr:hypothetical protein [Noviherbaspirillum sp.]
MTSFNDSIPDLKIERMNDGIGDGLILLEQDNSGNVDRVAIHPLHLRYMAEKFGLIETSDPQAARTIAILKRRMWMLRDRIDHLHNWLVNHSDHKHADLTYEVTYATATADIANEFCAEMEESEKPQEAGQLELIPS